MEGKKKELETKQWHRLADHDGSRVIVIVRAPMRNSNNQVSWGEEEAEDSVWSSRIEEPNESKSKAESSPSFSIFFLE